jgi:hypothetical protein
LLPFLRCALVFCVEVPENDHAVFGCRPDQKKKTRFAAEGSMPTGNFAARDPIICFFIFFFFFYSINFYRFIFLIFCLIIIIFNLIYIFIYFFLIYFYFVFFI